MAFLVLFWKPIAAFLAVLAVVIFVGAEKHGYDERRRDEGRAEIQQKWDTAIAAQAAREKAAAQEADDFANRLEAKRNADFDKVAKHSAELEARLAALSIGPDLTRSVRESIRAANGEDAGTVAADTSSSTGLAYDDWSRNLLREYRECRDQVINIVKWDDDRVKGASP